MTKSFLIVSLSFVFLSACSQTTEQTSPKSAPAPITEGKPVNVSTAVVSLKEDRDSEAIKNATKPTFEDGRKRAKINGESFEISSLPLLANHRILNLDMNQTARVSGRFIVVLTEKSDKVLDVLNSRFSIREISHNVYRVRTPEGMDMLLAYKTIRDVQGVRRVEMELDYTPPSKAETH